MSENEIVSIEEISEDVRKRIKRWMMEEGWRISEVTEERAKWVLIGEDGGGRNIIVSQRADRLDQVALSGSVVIGEAHRKKLENLPPQDRREFHWEINKSLLESGLEFAMMGDPLEGVGIGQRIYYDALTKDEFLQRVSDVRRGVMMVVGYARYYFNEVPEQPYGFNLDVD